MHIQEAVVSTPVLAAGAALAAAGVAVGVIKLDNRTMVQTALLASAFFVASLLRVPIGATSAHLILNGLTGMLLGWAVFPAVAVALALQAVLFGFGGLSTLGVNIVVMGLPGLCAYYLFGAMARRARSGRAAFAAGFGAGVFGIALGAVLLAAALRLSGAGFGPIAALVLGAHIPVMLIEGVVTGAAVAFLRRVRPETLWLGRTPASPVGDAA